MDYLKESLVKLDWSSIWSQLLVAGISFMVLKWFGFFHYIFKAVRTVVGFNRYRKKLGETCSSLIVIGRKQGFSMGEVFVPLDVSQSSHSQEKKDSHKINESYVLLGGPGAGKSTLVKNLILDQLRNRPFVTPFLVRLREYDGESSIDEYLTKKLEECSIPEADKYLRGVLLGEFTVCVLDGLDEVRPHLLDKVCSRINSFYHSYFESDRRAQLVVTCRKEAYRSHPLDIPRINEVRPLNDQQIQRFAVKWPLKFPDGKSHKTFMNELKNVPQVLELARSPLLLVGGLMQYTESNVGIPEQRVQYLDRITQWLLTDWATAQGHPPDPFRVAYEPLLSKLAFFMHSHEMSECQTVKVAELFKGWLPLFGFTEENADKMIESISTKTGILLRDTPGVVVFAQFGLQEFFASKIAVDQLGATKLSEASSKVWWREAVLLCVAKIVDPTQVLKSLFKINPLMGATAVAECATPSLEMQQTAMQVCVKAIEQNNSNAQAPTISLLRKFRDRQEESLCSELETRLETGDEPLRKRVGAVLALAGTTRASRVLLGYPSLLRSSLEDVGFLSSNMEDLLVAWTTNGDDTEAFVAIDLLCKSITLDREEQLVGLLSKLKKNRAERLATALVGYFENPQNVQPELDEKRLRNICECAHYIGEPTGYLSGKNVSPEDRWNLIRNPVPVALFLASQNQKAEPRAWRMLLNSLIWARYRGNFKVCLGVSLMGFALFAVKLGGDATCWPFAFWLSVGIISWAFLYPAEYPPWMEGHLRAKSGRVGAFAFFFGFLLAFLGCPKDGYIPENVNPVLFLAVTGIFCTISSAENFYQGFNILNLHCRRKFTDFFVVFALGSAFLSFVYWVSPFVGLCLGAFVYLVLFCVLLYASYVLFGDWALVRKTAKENGGLIFRF